MIVVLDPPEQRLDAVPVPRRDEQARARIVQTQRELAAQPGEKGQSVAPVQGDDDLAVAAAPEGVGGVVLLDFGAEEVVVVELAVDDGVDGGGGVVEGLDAGGVQVVDCEADVAQCYFFLTTGLEREKGRECGGIPILLSGLIHCPRESGPRCLIASRLASSCWESLVRSMLEGSSWWTMQLIPHMMRLEVGSCTQSADMWAFYVIYASGSRS